MSEKEAPVVALLNVALWQVRYTNHKKTMLTYRTQENVGTDEQQEYQGAIEYTDEASPPPARGSTILYVPSCGRERAP